MSSQIPAPLHPEDQNIKDFLARHEQFLKSLPEPEKAQQQVQERIERNTQAIRCFTDEVLHGRYSASQHGLLHAAISDADADLNAFNLDDDSEEQNSIRRMLNRVNQHAHPTTPPESDENAGALHPETKVFLSSEEAAQMLGFEPEVLRDMAKHRQIRAFADKGDWRFAKSDIEREIASREDEFDFSDVHLVTEKLLSLEEAAKMLGTSQEELRKMAMRRAVSSSADDEGEWLFKPSDIEELIKRGNVVSNSEKEQLPPDGLTDTTASELPTHPSVITTTRKVRNLPPPPSQLRKLKHLPVAEVVNVPPSDAEFELDVPPITVSNPVPPWPPIQLPPGKLPLDARPFPQRKATFSPRRGPNAPLPPEAEVHSSTAEPVHTGPEMVPPRPTPATDVPRQPHEAGTHAAHADESHAGDHHEKKHFKLIHLITVPVKFCYKHKNTIGVGIFGGIAGTAMIGFPLGTTLGAVGFATGHKLFGSSEPKAAASQGHGVH